MLRRLQEEPDAPSRTRRRRAARPALRPHRAVRALRAGERRAPGVPVPALPDPEGVARRAPPGRPVPRVRPGGHRRRRRGRAAVPLRGRAAAGHGRGARRAARDRRAAGAHPGEQPQGRRGLLPRARPGRRRGGAAQHRQARQDRARTRSPALLVAEAGATDDQATACLALARSAGPTTASSTAVRALAAGRARRTSCSTRASTSSAALIAGGGGAGARRRRGRPEDRARARLLHGVGLRDRAGRARAARLDLLGRPLRHAGLRRHEHLPGRRAVDRRLPAGVPPDRPRAWSRRRGRCPAPCSSRSATRTTRAASDAVAAALRARGIPVEVAPCAAKFGKQIRHADRRGIPFVWFARAEDERRRPTRSRTSARASRSTPTRRRGSRRPRTAGPGGPAG